MVDVATSNFRIKSGNTLPVVRVILESRNQRPLQDEDLTHLATIDFQLYPVAGGIAVLDDTGILVDSSRAEFGYDWTIPAPAPGTYYGFFHLTFDNGKELTVPNAADGPDMFVVEVT